MNFDFSEDLNMLRDDTSPVKDRIKHIKDLAFPGKIQFSACENTRKGARGLIVPLATQIGSPNEPDLLPQTGERLRQLGIRPREIALDGGFLEQLEHTWFCLTPRRGSACGVCAKCHEAVVDGMGHRLLPVSRRLHDVKWHTRWKPWQHVIDRVVG